MPGNPSNQEGDGMSYTIEAVERNNLEAKTFLDYLQRKNTHALGFLPYAALEEAIQRGHVLRAFENEEPCGYLIRGILRQETRILQIVVEDDARRIDHATALVEGLTALCNANRGHSISLHCAEDLPANLFWEAIGFSKVGKRLKNKTGKRWQHKHQIDLPAKEMARIIAKKEIKQAGLKNLHRLLVKGDARIGTLNLAKHRSKNHQFLIEGVE